VTDQPRDWDKELAEIDRLIARAPAQDPKPAPRAGTAKPTGPAAPAGPVAGRTGRPLGVWLRVGLGVVLGLALTQWPYARACGLGLFLYLGVVGMTVLAGVWGSVVSWRRRMGLAHAVALGVVLWGFGVAASVVLPRVGYARASLFWLCR